MAPLRCLCVFVLLAAAPARAVEVRVDAAQGISPLPSLPTVIVSPLTAAPSSLSALSVAPLSAPSFAAPALVSAPAASLAAPASAVVPSVARKAAPALSGQAAASLPTPGPGADRTAFGDLKAQWAALQNQAPVTEAVPDASGISPVGRDAYAVVLVAFREAVKAKPDGIAHERAARVAAAAAISGRGAEQAAADYRKARDSKPYGIGEDRASVLVVASALSGAPIEELIALYQDARDPLKGAVDPEGADRIVAAAALNSRGRGGLLAALDLLTDD